MTTLEIPENAVLSARNREVPFSQGIAQRESTLTGASMSVRLLRFPINDGEIEIMIAGDPPAWVTPTVEKLGRLLAMPRDGDTYGAKKVEPACVLSAIQTALEVMQDETPAPTVVPTSCGGVQLEWHTHGIDLEIEVCSPSRFLASCEDHKTGETWDESVFDFSRIRRALCEMARREAATSRQADIDLTSSIEPATSKSTLQPGGDPDAIVSDAYWQDKSLTELAAEQAVAPIQRLEDVWGAGSGLWTSDEEFEAFLVATKGADEGES